MDNWSETKKECYFDFVEQMLKDGYIVKKRKKAKPQANWALDAFELAYKTFPRKANKPSALKAWNALKPSSELIRAIVDHSEKAYINVEKIYIPHFSTYLNQERWKDEIIEVPIKLLKLPAEDDDLWGFAKEHGLKNPGTMNYFDYRNALRKEIEEKQLLAD